MSDEQSNITFIAMPDRIWGGIKTIPVSLKTVWVTEDEVRSVWPELTGESSKPGEPPRT